ncbi:phosphate ABC transporter permease subunit PstC [Candidatus Haliotispira prima]|uniref:Phosphate transport system permease protein n=1 Tax=Candidatus Haliotispira prima TaxID=3034016 RepID=A0ABY8MGJ7_9SPIO|nr:phosphate ABC transporter permease subunit PstC [Candidatus Haliotispira prima]
MKRQHWLLPYRSKAFAGFNRPERSAVNLGLWLWPVAQLLYSLGLLSLAPFNFIYDIVFLLLLALLICNVLGLVSLVKGRKRGYALFYNSALLFLPFSFIALYSLNLLAYSKQQSRNFNERIVRRCLATVALGVVCILGLLLTFIVFRGMVAMPLVATDPEQGLFDALLTRVRSWSLFFSHSSIGDFLFSSKWAPSDSPPSYGILGFIWGSVFVTALALSISVPIGLGSAIYIAEFAPKRLKSLLRMASELLAGLPSVVYGFFGAILIVPLVRGLFPSDLNTGYNAISGAIILAFMILPTIINISEVSLRSVSQTLRAGSLALGATKWQTVSQITVPAAISGILTSIVLGACRAVGETLAVLMVAGNAIKFAKLPIEPTRTLTMNIIAEMAYAQDDPSSGSYHLTSLFTTSVVLMLFIFLLNVFLSRVRRRIRLRLNPT